MTDAASPPAAAEPSMRRDVASAYAATAAKIGSWVIVSGLVYRFINPAEFAMLALIRGTIGILNYTTLGLSPAMIRMLAEARQARAARAARGESADAEGTLSYFANEPDVDVRSLYANGLLIALACGALGAAVTFGYAGVFDRFYHMPYRLVGQMFWVVLWMGLGTVLRLMSDAPGSLLQAHGQIAKDNFRLVEAEAAWVLLTLFALFAWPSDFRFTTANWRGISKLEMIAFCFTCSGAILFLRRSLYAQQLTHLLLPAWRFINGSTIKRLLAFGSLVLFAQLADYLYAPTDYILINKLLGWEQVAVYTPAMQLDAGLLLLVTGLSSVILPRTALAHTAGEVERVRRYYVYGTIFSGLLLLVAAVFVWLMAGILFRAWLGDPMRPTRAILPLVLVHTVIGGSSAVGRSILLGMGKVRPFTIAVLAAGATNVVLSYIFVRYLHLGLGGIVLGTIVAVVARCAVWMPWYVLRALREPAAVGKIDAGGELSRSGRPT